MYQNIEEIELYNNLDFEQNIKEKYNNIIIDIFNNNCPDKYDNDNNIQIISALYYYAHKDYNKAINLLLSSHNMDNLTATCSLGILYNILDEKDKSIKYLTYGADKNHILSATNLAYEYLCQGDFSLFLYYNKMGLDVNDENALINSIIYNWNIKKDYNLAINIFNKISNNYRACYEYAKLHKDIDEKKKYLIKAIQLKPKKAYIEMLIKHTGDYERYLLYKKNNININQLINIDNALTIKYLENDITKFSKCPICINNSSEKKELFKLKCNHSFCNNCIIKYSQKSCCICYASY